MVGRQREFAKLAVGDKNTYTGFAAGGHREPQGQAVGIAAVADPADIIAGLFESQRPAVRRLALKQRLIVGRLQHIAAVGGAAPFLGLITCVGGLGIAAAGAPLTHVETLT